MTGTRGRGSRLGWLTAEFVVVVLGVLVGLAVDAWRQERDDTAVEVGYLERLKANLEADTAAYALANRVNGGRYPMLDDFLAATAGEAPFPADPMDFARNLVASLHVDFAPPRRDTYDELISQGDLGRVSDPGIRLGLASYYAGIEDRQETVFLEWRETATRVEFALIEGLPWEVYRWIQSAGTATEQVIRDATDISVPPPTDAEIRDLLARSRRDDALRNLLFRQSQIQERLTQVHTQWAALASELLDILDEELTRLRGT